MASDAPEFTDLVRQFSKRRRRARGRKLAYPIYAGVLVGLLYGGPAIARAVDSLKAAHHADQTTFRIEAAAPYALVALALLVLTTLARQALWRGPVVVSEAEAAWLLPLPVSRRHFMLPRYLASGVLSILVAVALGSVSAVVLHAYGLGSIRQLVSASLIYAAALALVGLGLAAVAERSQKVADVVRASRGAVILVAGGLAALAGRAAAQPARSSAPTISHTFGLSARIGLVVLGLASATCGARVVQWIPSVALRKRASVGTAVSSAAYVVDLRRARLAVNSATHGRRRGLRLRPPRRSQLSIPWRDLSNVLTAPASFGWAITWSALAASAFAIAARQSVDSRDEIFPVLVAVVCGYVAALPYTEPTRLDADDFRRVRWSPYPIRSLTTRHAFTPVVLATIGQLGAAAVALVWLSGRDEALALSVALATGPVLAVAAMISAFRGAVPLQLIFAGAGGVGPAIVIVMYLAGPLAAVILGGLSLLPALHSYHSGSSAGVAAIESLLLGASSSSLLLSWARQRAHKRFTG
jgi:Family of unknown function (DUF6297)